MPPPRDYYERPWAAVPQGAVPELAPLRERFLLERLDAERARLRRPLRVLDFGCGSGHFAATMACAGCEVVAVDVAEEAVSRTRALERHDEVGGAGGGAAGEVDAADGGAPARGVQALLVEPEAPLPLEDVSFDAIWAGETIEHVADTAGTLSELRRVLRSGGLLLVSTPDHGPLLRLWLALSRSAFERRFDARGEHLRFYTRRSLYALFEDFGFEEVDVRGAGGLPGARRVLFASGRRKRF